MSDRPYIVSAKYSTIGIAPCRSSFRNVNTTIADMSGHFPRTRFLFTLLLLFSSLFLSCGGSKSDGGSLYMKRIGMTPEDLDKNINLLNPQFVIEERETGIFYLGMIANAGGEAGSPQMTAMNNLQSVSFLAFDTDGKLIDSLYTDKITRSGLGGTGSSSLTASAGVTWRPAPTIPQKLRLVMHIKSGMGAWPKEIMTSFSTPVYSEPIVLNLDYKPSGKGLEFILTAQRVAEASDEEYLPSAEMFVIRLFNGPTLLWSSSKGKSFAQMIGPVEPDQIGEKVEYRGVWNGTDSTGADAKAGPLTVVATIPAKPNAYTLSKEISWPMR